MKEITEGFYTASGHEEIILRGNARAYLRDYASAVLYDHARAVLYDNASADLYDDVSAELRGNARAYLYDHSSAYLHDHASAVLYSNARAVLFDDASAELYSNASAVLCGNARAYLYEHSSAVLYDHASVVDKRVGKTNAQTPEYQAPVTCPRCGRIGYVVSKTSVMRCSCDSCTHNWIEGVAKPKPTAKFEARNYSSNWMIVAPQVLINGLPHFPCFTCPENTKDSAEKVARELNAMFGVEA